MFYNELNLWKVRGTCPNHGDYIYNARKNEESVGCPICTVINLKNTLGENLDAKEIFKIEMWLVELQSMYECEALLQPKDIKEVYLQKAKEIKIFLDSQ